MRSTRGHKLITLIEIVSPSNKPPGPDRAAYLAKQEEILARDTNLIEIDLLRGGDHLLTRRDVVNMVWQLRGDYLILINCAWQRLEYTLYPIKLRELLPCIPVPLTQTEAEVPLDIQAAFARVYRGGAYERSIEYARPKLP